MTVNTPGISMFAMFVIAVVGFVALRGLIRLCSGSCKSSDSVFRALGVAAMIAVAMLILAATLFTGRQVSRKHIRAQVTAGEQSTSSISRLVSESTSDSGTQVTTTSTVEGEMLVVPLSDQILSDLIGAEGVEAIERINETVPPELRQAYAMIPIPGPGAGTVAPVLRGTIGPVVLSERGISMIQTAVSNLLPESDESTELVAEAEVDVSTKPFVAPDWVENPGDGYIVVKSRFAEPSIPTEELLRPEIEEALKAQVETLITTRFKTDDGWKQYVDLSVTSAAVEDCIVKTADETELIPTTRGDYPMQRTYALIDLPETLKAETVSKVRSSIQHSRLYALCGAVGILWLAALFLGIAARAGQSESFFRKLATLPMIGVLLIPCAVMFVAVVSAMIRGETLDFSVSRDRVVCVIDRIAE